MQVPARVRPLLGLTALGGLALTAWAASPVFDPTLDAPEASSSVELGDAQLFVDVAEPAVHDGVVRIAATLGLARDVTPSRAFTFAVDASALSLRPAGGCAGDENGDGRVDTVLDCEIATALALLDALEADGSVGEVGVVLYETWGASADTRPEAGFQLFASPDADLDGDGERDVETVLRSIRSEVLSRGGVRVESFTRSSASPSHYGTNFGQGLRRSCENLAAAGFDDRTLVFLSGHHATRGLRVETYIPCEPQVTIHTLAVGAGASCDSDPKDRGSLREIAAIGGGTCTEVAGPADLPGLSVTPFDGEVASVTLSVDGGPEVDVSGSLSAPLPHEGVGALHLSHELTGLDGGDHEVCVTVTAWVDGAPERVTGCVDVQTNAPPVADAGPDLRVVEGTVAHLDASGSTDPDGDPLSYRWELVSADGPTLLPSAPDRATAAVQTRDDGVYTYRLTVSDGLVEATDTVTLTVDNGAPSIADLQVDPAMAGGETTLAAALTDPGVDDTHEALVDWGDGTVTAVDVGALDGGAAGLTASHVYEDPGAYAVTLTVVDDDGGRDAQTVTVDVSHPVALWADGGAADALRWTGGRGEVSGLVHSNGGLRVHGAPKTVDGPVRYVTHLQVSGAVSLDPERTSRTDRPVSFALSDYAPGGDAAARAGGAFHDVSSECRGGTWRPQGALAAGLYWADCDVRLTPGALRDPVTVVASGRIRVEGAGGDLRPYTDGLLFLSGDGADDAVALASRGATYAGYVTSEHGGVAVTSSSQTFACGIVADRIAIAGSDHAVHAADCRSRAQALSHRGAAFARVGMTAPGRATRPGARCAPGAVRIEAPEAAAFVEASTDVRVRAAVDAASWRVLARPAGEGADRVLARGTGVVPGVPGDLDPGVVDNGLWTLRIEVTDADGATCADERAVVVRGDDALADRIVARDTGWTEGAVLRRTWRGARIDRVGDFGNGWTLASADTRVQVDGALGAGPWRPCDDDGPCLTSDAPRLVVVRWPDDAVDAFALTPEVDADGRLVAAFTALEGADAVLEPADDAALALVDGLLVDRTGAPWDPARFVLTVESGDAFVLDRGDGLVATVDPWGGVVEHTRDGVLRDGAPVVTFERDADGRIVQAVFADGAVHDYVYDAAGDLVAVIDAHGDVVVQGDSSE